MRFPGRDHLRGLLQLSFVILVALAVPAWVCRSKSLEESLSLKKVRPPKVLLASGGVNDVHSGIALLNKEKPDWVLIGNSLLNTRIDPNFLQQLSGRKPFKLTASATKSAMWFTFMKQILVPSKTKPACVSIFFRDMDLTWPELRIRRNEPMIDHLNGRSAPEWKMVMAGYDASRLLSFGAATRMVSTGIEDLFPGERLRRWSRDEIQKQAWHFSNLGQGVLGSARRAELNDRFSLDHQRQSTAARQVVGDEDEGDVLNEADTDDLDATRPAAFDAAPEESFLPHMIQLAKDHGFLLHFHRIKARPESAEDTNTPPEMAAYLADLKRYLDQQGCIFTDESHQPGITAEMYVDDAHIRTTPDIQQAYMQQFWQCVKPILATASKS